MAQSDMTVDHARGLGLLAYLSFIKIKSTQQIAQLEYNNDSIELDTFLTSRYNCLCEAVDEFLNELKNHISSTNSKNAFKCISRSLEYGAKDSSNQFCELKDMFDKIDREAKEFIEEPQDCYRNKIAAIQSLAALDSYKKNLCSESICSTKSSNGLIKLLNALHINYSTSKSLTPGQVA